MNCRAEKLGVRFIMVIDRTAVKPGGVLADALPNSALEASAGSALHLGSPVPFPRRVNSNVRPLTVMAKKRIEKVDN